MLRGCAQLLRSAAAQQLLAGTQNASALTSLGAALACGVRQLGLQQSLLPALQPGGSRSFASQGDGGSSEGGHAAAESTQQPRPPAAGVAAAAVSAPAEERGTGGDTLNAELGLNLADGEQVLAEWGKAMDRGDWDRAWDIFETAYPVDGDEFPPLEDLLAWDPEEDVKAERRARELALQEEFARSRVQRVDEQGRSHATGKRKTSIARVWLRPGAGHIMVNKRPFDRYFPALVRRNDVITPFVVTDTLGEFDVMVRVHGGGSTGQAQAVRHGIARALQLYEPELRADLKVAGLLTRDSRIVERKKPGRKKARKSFQWVKR